MKTRILPILAALFALHAVLRAGPLGDAVQPYVDNGALAGAVLLAASNEKILACEPVGLADIASKKPMREDTMFWIASMTKPMTAVCVMMLVDEGKISLDDPVSKYIPAFAAPRKIVPQNATSAINPDGTAIPTARQRPVVSTSSDSPPNRKSKIQNSTTPITIRHLLSHTSGLRRFAPPVRPWHNEKVDRLPLAKAVERYAASDLLFEPGADYSYGNAGINTAGLIIEIVSGMPYAIFVQKRLLDPLGMKDTTFWPSGGQLDRIATAYKGDPNKRTLTPDTGPFLSHPLDDRQSRHAEPGAGLFSTAADLARFGQLLLNKGVFNGHRLLSENAIAEMTRRQTPPHAKSSYGLCIDNIGPDSFDHNGAFGTNITIWPGENLVTIFMVQRVSKYGAPDGGKARPAFEKQARQMASTPSSTTKQ